MPEFDPSKLEKSASDSVLEKAHFAAIVDSADDAIISKTLDGIITSWNRAAQNIFGYTPEEMIGRPIQLLIPADHPDEEPSIIERLKRGVKIEHYETQRIRKDGSVIDISLTVSPIRDSTGRIVGASKIARDITERKRLEAAMKEALQATEEARKQAELANKLKDEFLATVSHELRTPLTAIMGWIGMLRTGQLERSKHDKGLEVIERNVHSQAQLIEDLLDISRITSGKLRLNIADVDMSNVIKSAIEAIRPAATARNIRIVTVFDSNAGPIGGDFERLQQVVWNLLSNAVKFTPRDGRVQVSLERIHSHVELTVEDNGEGIEPDFLPYIFDRFSQADASTRRAKGGLGLGLAIVKSIVELHGGSCQVFSEGAGRGATLRIKLPLAPLRRLPVEQFVRSQKPTSVREVSDLAGLRILVVDDEADTCEMLETLLTRAGAVVHCAFSADQALQALERTAFELLISDIGMPEKDGYDLIRAVRSRDSKDRRLPAVALTALARVEDRVKALTAGYQMHVAKPVQAEELLVIIGSLASLISHRP